MPGIQLQDFPYPLSSQIQVVTRHGDLGVQAHGVVGSVPLRNGDTLQILPKVGEANFLRMFFRGTGLRSTFDREYDEFTQYAVSQDASFAVLAARQMVVAVREVLRLGATTRRVSRVQRMSAAAGSVDPMRTAIALARREADPVCTRVRVRSHDAPENRLIAVALLRAANLLQGDERRDALDVQRRWHIRVKESTLTASDLGMLEELLARNHFGGPRAYYKMAVTLGLVLLGSLGMLLSNEPSLEGEALLMNSADVFERYVRAVISERYASEGYVVTKGGTTVRSLYDDGAFTIDPDVVIEREQSLVLIADAKYKEPSADDHYQMLAYLSTTGVSRGVLVTPYGREGKVQLRRRTTPSQLTTVVAGLPMDDLAEAEAFLRDILDRTA
jgi:5-methylcytosine-specific restriction endonuclease McrBC regulatory subunit McrC